MQHNIAYKSSESQEKNIQNDIPSSQEFFEMLDHEIREFARITIINTITQEFNQFIGASSYERSDDRTNYRNGVRFRNFETRFGVIEDIPIPRARGKQFMPRLFARWRRREHKITRTIADLFIHGISTRKIKKLSKALWGREYSAATASRCNQVLQEDYLRWMNRPITQSIRYLIVDAVHLKVRRHWISKESLLCAIGITADGKKDFLGFLLGGRESTRSWEDLLLMLLRRGLSTDHLKLVVVDGNAGLLSALESLLPGVPVQRCIVHKIRNIVGKCPRSLKGIVPAEAKQIFYATNESEARQRFVAFKERWITQLPTVVECIEKDLDQLLAFYAFPYKHWIKIRSTNVIERAFKEFRRRVKIMETFPNETSYLRIMLSLAKMLNENWEYKPITDF